MTTRDLAAVLWDMDGTLIDSEPLWLEAEFAMLGRYGLELGADIRERLVGSGLEAAARLFQDLGVPLSTGEIISEWTKHVGDGLRSNPPQWRPGVIEVLISLRDAGIPSAIVTAAVRELADTVAEMLPEGTISAIVAGDEVEYEKPHPDPYLRGAAALGVPIDSCLAVEDSRNGLRSASASGAVAVGVPNLVPLSDAPAHDLWPTLSGLSADDFIERFRTLRFKAARNTTRDLLRYGDRVQLTDPRGKRNTLTLEHGGEFHSHQGVLRHGDLVGLPDGSVVSNSAGIQYLALRPLLSDYVMSMPRGAAIVYPKDAAQIVSLADIRPGATVVEAGVGSGALTLHLLRAVGTEGRVHSFERRGEFADIARGNVRGFFGEHPRNWALTVGDLQEELSAAFDPGSADRVVLDMLAPWECLDEVAAALAPGGVLICYVATVTQLSRVAEGIRAVGHFTHPQASETMVRGWHVEGLAVRPDHRMVAHTGFLITARRLAPGAVLPQPKRRASKSEYSAEDAAAWIPDHTEDGDPVWTEEALGERVKSDRILRKKARDAQQISAARGAAEDSC